MNTHERYRRKFERDYGKPLDGIEHVREPVRCPGCGHLLVIVPCLECARLAEKNHAIRVAALGESGWEN